MEIRAPLDDHWGQRSRAIVQLEPNATAGGVAALRVHRHREHHVRHQAGNLDFNGRTPFSEFDTVAPAPPTLVELDMPQAGFPNKINANNVETVQLAITPPADALAGDTVIARIYGGDAETTPTFDETFVERTGTVVAAGHPGRSIDFSGTLGTAASPGLDGGEITFAAQMQSRQRAIWICAQRQPMRIPVFDVTPPTLLSAGPPGSGNDIFTDGEWLSYYGVAERRAGVRGDHRGWGQPGGQHVWVQCGRSLLDAAAGARDA